MKKLNKNINKIRLLLISFMVSSFYITANAQCPDGLYISEFVYDVCNGSPLADGTAPGGEYIVVTNNTSTPINLAGAEFDDDGDVTNGNGTIFSGGTVPANGCLIIGSDTQANWEAEYGPVAATGCSYYDASVDGWQALNNGGDNIGITGACNNGSYTDLTGDGEAVVFNPTTMMFELGGVVSIHPDCGPQTYTPGTTPPPGAPPCPDFTGIAAGDLDIGLTESTCPAGDTTPSGGSITAPTTMCPAGSTLQYSFDNFATPGTTTLPMYDQSNTLTVTTSCVCDDDATLSSTVSTVTTMPGMCAICDAAIATSTPAVTVDSESTCAMAGGTLMGGAISAATCPAGSTVEYSTDGTNWSTTLPTYDQESPITVTARCVCDIDPSVIGTGTAVTTVPGICPPPAEVCNACDCAAAPNSYTINTVADNGSQAGYTLTYALTVPMPDFATATPAAGAPASFPGLLDNTAYDVCAFNVLDGDLAAFQAALTAANSADAIAGNAPFDAFCYEVICTTFPAEDCMCVQCPDLTLAGSEAPPVVIDSEAGCDTSTMPFTTTTGVTSDVTATCPMGSSIEYSFDMGTTWVATFMDTYDQTAPVEIRTRCVCDEDNMVIGPETVVVTNPQPACPAEVCPACDCTNPDAPYTINTVALGQNGFTLVYGLTGSPTYTTMSPAVTNPSTPISFGPLEDGIMYEVCVFNIIDADATAFEAALVDDAAQAAAVAGTAPFDTFCYEAICTTFMDDCMCAACPVVTTPIATTEEICDGGTPVLDASTLMLDDPTLAQDGSGTITVSWFTDAAFTTPFAGTVDYAAAGGDGCNTVDVTLYAAIECIDIPDPLIAAGETTLTIYPNYDAALVDMVTNNECEVPMVASSCANYVITPDPANPPAPTPGTTATFNYTIEYGAGPNGTSCFSEPFTVTVNCAAVGCPSATPDDATAGICTGTFGTEISDWQALVNANAAIADANTDAAVIYSTDLPADVSQAAPPTPGVIEGIHTGADNCVAESQLLHAYLLCFGEDAVSGTADDSYLFLGMITLTVYPEVQPTNEVSDPVACTTTISPTCAGDTFDMGTNPTGGANTANWDAVAGVYTAQPGDLAGTLDIMVSSGIAGNTCPPITVTITTPACADAPVPSITIDKDDADNGDDTQISTNGEATFTITITNDGTEDLCNIMLTDIPSDSSVDVTMCEPTFASIDTDNGTVAAGSGDGQLNVGESETYTCTVTGITTGFSNSMEVVAEGCDTGAGVTLMDDDPTEVTVPMTTPSIEIVKDDADNSDDTQEVMTGSDATFTITVTNNGSADLENVVVSDPLSPACDITLTATELATVGNGDGVFNPGESYTYTCTTTGGVTMDFTNTASVNANEVGDPMSEVTDDDDTEVTTPVVLPCDIQIVIIDQQCDNNNTPEDETDDITTYSYAVLDNGGGGTTWTDGTITNGTYGQNGTVGMITVNPLTTATVNITDETDSTCVATVDLMNTGCATPQIPTLSQWGLICLALLLMIFGALKLSAPILTYNQRKI